MRNRNSWLFAAVVGLVLSTPGQGYAQDAPPPAAVVSVPTPATPQNVVMTAPGNRFNPAMVVIQAGQTVTWMNTSGGFHNFTLDDGSFRCANGCDQTGGNGQPATNVWMFTLAFNTPGVFPYFCEVHGEPGQGMVGTIMVQAPGQAQAPQAPTGPTVRDRAAAADPR
jgi:plastocyanin